MSTNNHQGPRVRRRHHPYRWIVAGTALLALAIVTIAIAVTSGLSGSTYRRTGETSSMGMPVIATPGSSSGTQEFAGLVATPRSWALGRVPLNVAVRPTWQFRNTSGDTVMLGQPHVEVNEGCCPGEITFRGPTTLEPDQTTDLVFELSMHPGMDGPHDMTVHVPMQHADGTTGTLDVTVTGDFRD